MTKLMEWLFGFVLFVGVWAALVTRQIKSNLTEEFMFIILPFPLIALIVFGLYAVTVVLWRVYTFNDCEEAAKELQKEILQAREELRKKGMIFDS